MSLAERSQSAQKRLRPRIEEREPRAVGATRVAEQLRVQRPTEGVRVDDVQAAVPHGGRDAGQGVHDPRDARSHLLRRRRPAGRVLGVRGAREVDQVVVLGLVELQGRAHGVEHVLRHAAGVAALEARVVLDADAGEEGDLLAAQAGNPALSAEGGQARPLRRDLGPAGGEELADVVFVAHVAFTVGHSGARWEALAIPLTTVPSSTHRIAGFMPP